MTQILIIDDSEEFRATTEEILVDAGYQVAATSSLEEAEPILENSPPDLILCDLVMPVSDDEELKEESGSAVAGAHAIQRISKLKPGVPIVAISGNVPSEALKAIAGFGAVESLEKPFSRDKLLNVVKRLVG
ncbi:MAG: response regulator [Candidatus Dadabacteria bacterium]|nr:MAG: response regulator [Candidatus Dadabacteria bacterium]